MARRAAGTFTTRERGEGRERVDRAGQGMIERHEARLGVCLGREGWAVQDIANTSMTREREEEHELGRVVRVRPLIGVGAVGQGQEKMTTMGGALGNEATEDEKERKNKCN